MKINMKVRLKSKTFWLTVIPAVLEAVYCILDAFGAAPKVDKTSVEAAVMAVLGLLTVSGVIIDHTTEGIRDSDRALTYENPACDHPSASGIGCFIAGLFGKRGESGNEESK